MIPYRWNKDQGVWGEPRMRGDDPFHLFSYY